MNRWSFVLVSLLLLVAIFFGWLWFHRPPDRLFVASRIWFSLARAGKGLSEVDAQNLAGLVLRDIGREIMSEDFNMARKVYAPGVVLKGEGGCRIAVKNASLKVDNVELYLHSLCISDESLCIEFEVKGLKNAVILPGVGRIYPDVPNTLVVDDRGVERGSEGCLR